MCWANGADAAWAGEPDDVLVWAELVSWIPILDIGDEGVRGNTHWEFCV